MGKTTRFHPVGLHVIRGGLEYGGFKVGRVEQTFLDPTHQAAHYVTEIIKSPSDLNALSLSDIKSAVNSCFAADVYCSRLWATKSGKFYIQLNTCLTPAEESDLTWLTVEEDGRVSEVNHE